IKFIYTGPTTADSAKQIEMIDNLITQGVDAIAVAPIFAINQLVTSLLEISV
ncbi:MAG: substrate-binding domain-containing protein, partial [bacterium]|nr:substrate-binding domain-containing protein [bacterium]